MLPISLNAVLGSPVPSFKNCKRVTKRGGLITDPKVKKRMQALENAILYALYSGCQTIENATGLECRRQLQTALSGLSDDSLKEVPEFSFGVEKVNPGSEGVLIIISEV